ncbi:ExbD/TolR family protein [Azoarcus olearius]|uniref:Biopolymer transport protein ExbD n=1 Tax=Azoarcus sp. (strain BH72) TaxID=418699 RepID=A1K7Z4_AZOSB|nr:biopolymer transporter ExbD [Azoarcus olearius]ANQ85492.1 putative biopolymer transport protein ExbD [Azoarcus olearius]CAL94949.1 putative biopolymer transport protein ExbD [Azoarcus olearius]
MGMNVAAAGGSGDPEVLVDINTTPLIDVLLVLLIMLIITIPIQLHSVNMNMPVGTPPPPTTPPEVVRIDIDPAGTVLWNGEALADADALESRLTTVAALESPPELHVNPDKRVAYKSVATVMAAVQRKGLTKVGLIGAEQFL